MSKEEADLFDLMEDQDVGEDGEPGLSQSRGDRRIGGLSKGLNELRNQFSELKDLLLAQGQNKQVEDETPQFDTKEEELLWTLTQHSKRLEGKVKAMEERTESEKRDVALNKAATSVLKGVDFGDQGEFAHSLMITYMKQHPKADEDEIKGYASKLIKLSGKTQKTVDKQYADKKKQDAQTTQRPRGSSGSAPKAEAPRQETPRKTFGKRSDEFSKARERAMARLAQED